MPESLRDRVARVLATADGYDWGKIPRWALYRTETLRRADALIAAGLVAEPEWEYGVRWFGDRSGTVEYHDRKPWRAEKAARKVAERKHGDTIERRRTYRPGPWEEVAS